MSCFMALWISVDRGEIARLPFSIGRLYKSLPCWLRLPQCPLTFSKATLTFYREANNDPIYWRSLERKSTTPISRQIISNEHFNESGYRRRQNHCPSLKQHICKQDSHPPC